MRPTVLTSVTALLVAAAFAVPGLSQEAGTPAEATTAGDEEAPAAAEATAPADSEAEPAPTEEPAPAPSASELKTADESYDLKVKELEGRINELKEQIFRSKAKLTLLTEQVTGGLGTGASAVIVHENGMGGNFLLVEAHYFLDGAPIWQDTDEEGTRLTEQKERQLFDGNLVEGSHTLNVQLIYKGNGSGVFSYLSGYTFRLKNSITFKAEPGKVVTIRAVGYEKGNFTTELTERPDIKFEQKIAEAQKSAKSD
jgi:uncharacterized small protein (DUF1192 family)